MLWETRANPICQKNRKSHFLKTPKKFNFGSLWVPSSGILFVSFSGALLDRLWGVLGRIWVPFGFHFGPILDAFWDTL